MSKVEEPILTYPIISRVHGQLPDIHDLAKSTKHGITMKLAEKVREFYGLTQVEMISLNECTLTVKGLDAFEGSPILDIKPANI